MTSSSTAGRMPLLFIGHGNPMNAIQRNAYTEGWEEIGRRLPRPRAVLSISAHWFAAGTMVTVSERPRTIHDFGGFPPELFSFEYPAPGDPSLIDAIRGHLAPLKVHSDSRWGLDHGTWSVLCHIYPDASVPVVQLSIDDTAPPALHYEFGRRLTALRDDRVLILGSGNLVHNLHAYAWGRHPIEPFDWALRFERQARELIERGEHQPLIDYERLGREALLAAPTPEHFLPLLYVLGASDPGETVSFPVEGIDGGSVSMLSIRIG